MKNLNSMKTIKLLAVLFISALTFTACSSNDHDGDDHDHGEELITTAIYTLVNDSDNTDLVTLTYTDIDGEGGADGVTLVSGPLTSGATYTGEIVLLNATESPAEDITEEILAEAEEHEFFYLNNLGLTISKLDTDANGNPLGINTSLTTGAAGSGVLEIILKHEPTKPNDNTPSGAGGSEDIHVEFSVTVQ